MKIKSLFKRFVAMVVCLSIIIISSASSYASESDCKEHNPPGGGYVLWKTTTGNTDQEAFYLTTGIGTCSVVFPGLGVELFITATLYSALYTWNPLGEGRGDYVSYIYYQKSSSGFWEHTLYYTTNRNTGEKVYLGCDVNRYWISNDA